MKHVEGEREDECSRDDDERASAAAADTEEKLNSLHGAP